MLTAATGYTGGQDILSIPTNSLVVMQTICLLLSVIVMLINYSVTNDMIDFDLILMVLLHYERIYVQNSRNYSILLVFYSTTGIILGIKPCIIKS